MGPVKASFRVRVPAPTLMAKTLEEAIENQLRVHAALDAGEHIPGWRTASLKENFEFKSAFHHGTGKYPVCKCCGAVCDCHMEWFGADGILLCPNCFLDGT